MAEQVKVNVVQNTGKDGKVVAVGVEAPDGHVTPATPEQAHDPAFQDKVRQAFTERTTPAMPDRRDIADRNGGTAHSKIEE